VPREVNGTREDMANLHKEFHGGLGYGIQHV
jgi:hypothetical protein